MNIFEGSDISLMMFIGPLVVLLVTISGLCLIYSLIFKKMLPKTVFNFLLTGVALLGAYIWAIPMNMGYYEFFKNWGM